MTRDPARMTAPPLRADLGPAPRLGYVESPLARAADRREDSGFLDAAERQPGAGGYVVGGELIVLKKRGNAFAAMFEPDAARRLGAGERVFLGLAGEAGRFGFGIAPETAEALKADPAYHVSDLRSIAVQGLVEHDHLTAIAE